MTATEFTQGFTKWPSYHAVDPKENKLWKTAKQLTSDVLGDQQKIRDTLSQASKAVIIGQLFSEKYYEVSLVLMRYKYLYIRTNEVLDLRQKLFDRLATRVDELAKKVIQTLKKREAFDPKKFTTYK